MAAVDSFRGVDPLVSPALEAYAAAHSLPETPARLAARTDTERDVPDAGMLIGALEGALLHGLIRISGARRVLEIGTFTGYSALAMAEALPKGGSVLTCEIDPRHAAHARRHFDASPVGARIDLRVGPALETIAPLWGPFDLVFVDADKGNYPAYYAEARRLAPRGLIVIDNVLWSGRVLEETTTDRDTRAIQTVNRQVRDDPGVESVLLPVRDGVLVVWPRVVPPDRT